MEWSGQDFSRVDFVEVVEVEDHLRRLGVTAELAPIGHHEGVADGHPSAVLLLPDDHPAWVDLPQTAPIRALVRWAEPRDPDRDDPLWEALRAYRAELRWLATCGASPATLDEMGDALHAVFTGAGAWPLDRLGLSSRVWSRLAKGLPTLRDTPPPPWKVADLPGDLSRVHYAFGVAEATVDALREALEVHLRTWRYARAGVDPAELSRDPGDGAVLSSGLDELASLF